MLNVNIDVLVCLEGTMCIVHTSKALILYQTYS